MSLEVADVAELSPLAGSALINVLGYILRTVGARLLKSMSETGNLKTNFLQSLIDGLDVARVARI